MVFLMPWITDSPSRSHKARDPRQKRSTVEIQVDGVHTSPTLGVATPNLFGVKFWLSLIIGIFTFEIIDNFINIGIVKFHISDNFGNI